MSHNEMTDTFISRQPGNLEIVLPRAMVEKALRTLAEITAAPELGDAMELAWFKCDPGTDTVVRKCISMLVTLYRSAMDGNVRPPLDLARLYGEIYRQRADAAIYPQGPIP